MGKEIVNWSKKGKDGNKYHVSKTKKNLAQVVLW